MPLNFQKTQNVFGVTLFTIVCHTVNNEFILLMYTQYNWAYSYNILVFSEFEYN